MPVRYVLVLAAIGLGGSACQTVQSTKHDDQGSVTRAKLPTEEGNGSSSPTPEPVPAGEERWLPLGGRPGAQLELQPADLTTSFGETPLTVTVFNHGSPVGKKALDAIAQSVKLKRWPELTDVPLQVTNIADASGVQQADQFAHITFASQEPLTDRWYALLVDRLPPGIQWPEFTNLYDLPAGGKATRFRIGSEPVVASVRVYSKGIGDVAYVDFSERVEGDDQLIELSGVGVRCAAGGGAKNVVVGGDGSSGLVLPNTADASYNTIALHCSGALDVEKPVSLSLASGLRSTSGPALNRGQSAGLDIAPGQWLRWGDGGVVHRPSAP